MATPGELVGATAQSLGISESIVVQYDRALSEAGLRSKSGRGSSAARVTAQDATNLLLAILGSPVAGGVVKDAPQVCRAYRELSFLSRPSEISACAAYGLPQLSKPECIKTLGTALDSLIAGVWTKRLFKLPIEVGKPMGRTTAERLLNITIRGPRPWASIECIGWEFRDSLKTPMPRLFFADTKGTSSSSRSDMYQQRHITFRTLAALGNLIAGNKNA